jgi:23S rRNA (pseudouridine1915-N3)-methyltransferase
MKLKIAWIGKTKSAAIRTLTDDYLGRISRYVKVESQELHSEAALLKQFEQSAARTKPFVVFLDSRGRELTSEQFAAFLRQHQDRGTQLLFFAVGPADGFSPAARDSASETLSLARITLPHELARVVLLEQLYRAFTILAGHPYHSGH